ncbi:MAG: hypothetical protein QNJ49_04750 [Mastigocoleus sp. MO_167.B18]|nr:hypothetical protein [Mastigocoleus sp. MO_167.B18]
MLRLYRSQKSEIRNQESGVRSRRDVACYVCTGIRNQESGIGNWELGVNNQE